MPNRNGTPYATKEWRVVKAAVLRRDGYRCQVRGPRCIGHATEPDHIVALILGGSPYDMSNLRAACRPCNASLGAALGNRLRAGNQTSRAW